MPGVCELELIHIHSPFRHLSYGYQARFCFVVVYKRKNISLIIALYKKEKKFIK